MKITPASLRSDPGRNHPEQVAGIDPEPVAELCGISIRSSVPMVPGDWGEVACAFWWARPHRLPRGGKKGTLYFSDIQSNLKVFPVTVYYNSGIE